jgi:hypothetical protein
MFLEVWTPSTVPVNSDLHRIKIIFHLSVMQNFGIEKRKASEFLRASPRVCQNLLGKSCVLPTSKKLCKVKKRIHLQQFGIIHLPNPDLTYIRNPERNKIMYVPFHLLKNLHQESFSIIFLFHPST